MLWRILRGIEQNGKPWEILRTENLFHHFAGFSIDPVSSLWTGNFRVESRNAHKIQSYCQQRYSVSGKILDILPTLIIIHFLTVPSQSPLSSGEQKTHFRYIDYLWGEQDFVNMRGA